MKEGKEEEAQMSRDIILAFRHGVLLQGPSSVEREGEGGRLKRLLRCECDGAVRHAVVVGE